MKTIIKETNRRIRYLITGAAGFIGYHLSLSLLLEKQTVIGVDLLTDYYDISIKNKRLNELKKYSNFYFHQQDISNYSIISDIFKKHKPDIVINLAAQAGVIVKDSLVKNYINSNIWGFEVIVQICAKMKVPLIYASSSSVYGDSPNIPFKEQERDLSPLSLYASTKLHNEQVAAFYGKHLSLKNVGLRFFSVYGEDMRPDMAINKFTSAIFYKKQITIYGDKETARDFTYIEDLNHAIKLIALGMLSERILSPIYNIGNEFPVKIINVLSLLEDLMGSKTFVNYSPLREGEAKVTFSDTSLLYKDFNYKPSTNIKEGLSKFVLWYKKNQIEF